MNAALLDLHKLADGHGDVHLTDFVEEHFLGEQASLSLLIRVAVTLKAGGEHQRDWGPGDEDEEKRRWNRAACH